MAKAPSMPLFCGDYLGATMGLSLEQSGAYLHILMATWANGGKPFPDDDAMLARVCRVTTVRFRDKIRPAIVGFFDLADGTWRNQRLEREWEYVAERAATARENGKKSRGPRRPPPRGNESKNHQKTRDVGDSVQNDKPLNYNGTGNPAGSSWDTQPSNTQPHVSTYREVDSSLDPPDFKPAPAPSGAGRGPVAYAGKNFSLNEQMYSDFRRRYHAIKDFAAALQTLDADLRGSTRDKVLAILQARLNGMHQAALAKQPAAKVGARWNNAGKRIV